MFIYFERGSECKQGRGRERERERERILGRFHAVSAEPDVRLNLMNRTVKLWPEPKSEVRPLTNWATQALQIYISFKYNSNGILDENNQKIMVKTLA